MRCWAGLAVVAALMAAPAGAEDPAISWCGSSHNVTAGVSSTVAMQVFAPGPTLEGQWPDIGLYGRFTGDLNYSYACGIDHICLQAEGILRELEAGGFPDGTEVAMTITLDMAADRASARGVYRIDAIPGIDGEQFGILELGACGVV